MANASTSAKDLLGPISADLPAGEDLEGSPDWLAIREARRADDPHSRGKWERPVKVADWNSVLELSSRALAEKTKDLRIGIWRLEAAIHILGFRGLSDGLELLNGLILEFWEKGLYPERDLRAGALQWIGHRDKLPLLLRLVPLTSRAGSGRDFNLADWKQSIQIGSEKDTFDAYGNLDEGKRSRYEATVKSGGVSKEMMLAAVQSTPKNFFNGLYADVSVSRDALLAFASKVDEVLKEDAPSFLETREVIEACVDAIDRMSDGIFTRKPAEVTKNAVPLETEPGPNRPLPTDLPGMFFEAESSRPAGSWQQAFEIVREGKVEEGLATMAQLAAAEHGRARFVRRLQLAEICLDKNRNRLAVAILEDLASQIDRAKLEDWESPQLIGRIWGRLGRCYENTDRSDRADELFNRLRGLDPWQALIWDRKA